MTGRQGQWQEDLFVANSLRELIAKDRALRRVDRVLDLSWLRADIAECRCEEIGRPTIDPQAMLRDLNSHLACRRHAMAKVGVCLFLALATSTPSASAQIRPPFLRAENSTVSNAAEAPCDTSGLNRVPVRCWLWQQFVILPKDKADRNGGYQEIEGIAPRYGHPTYEELDGKTVTITKVEWQQYSLSPNLSRWIVTFKTGENGPFYTTNAVPLSGESRDDAVVDCFVLQRDLQAAREVYLNNRYWPLLSRLPLLDENETLAPAEWISLNKFEPATIVDVLASPLAATPIRIVVNNDIGQKGYFDIAMSETNRSSSLGYGIGSFSKTMSDKDPKLAHNWSDDVWKAIESGKVLQGMTMEQVRLSLGEPLEVSRTTVGGRTHEQWVYGAGNYLYFDDGLLKTTNN
jgi:hypothetical protein